MIRPGSTPGFPVTDRRRWTSGSGGKSPAPFRPRHPTMPRMSHRMLCCLIAATALAGESGDPGREARRLHDQARQANDVWTGLQLEAWSDAHDGPSMSPDILGRTRLIGSPLFAFGDPISRYWPHPDGILVIAGDRLFHLHHDGRPLELSLRFPFWPHSAWLSGNRRYVGIVELRGPRERRTAVAAVLDRRSREVVLRREVPLPPGNVDVYDWVHGSCRVAEDGTALAFNVHRRAGPDWHRTIVCTAENHRAVPRIHEVRAVGSGGDWLLYEGMERNEWLDRGDVKQPVHSYRHGPGLLAVEVENDEAFVLVRPDGSEVGLVPPFEPGRGARLEEIGAHLVVVSGGGAKAPELTDFLGNPVEGGTEIPETQAFYRWRDLVADPEAGPEFSLEQRWEVARAHDFAVLDWRDKTLSVVRMGGEEAVRETLYEADAPITYAHASHHHYLVHTADDRRVVDRRGSELWRGTCDDGWVKTREHLLVRDGSREEPAFRLIHLAVDPDERREVHLDLEKRGWRIDVDLHRPRVVARLGYDFRILDPDSGEVRGRYDYVEDPEDPRPERRAPRWRGEANHTGSRFVDHGRLLHKNAEWVDGPPENRWVPRDVAPLGAGLLVVARHGYIYSARRASGDFEPVDQIYGADGFGTDSKERALFVTDGRGRRILGLVDRGPSIETDHPKVGERADSLDPGRWRENGDTFIPPRERRVRWDRGLCGFGVEAIRSSQDGHCYCVTASVIIDLSSTAAKKVASLDD